MPKTLSVAAIKEGTVIDHIPAGWALKIVDLLRLREKRYKTTLGLNLDSSLGYKDIIKIEGHFLTKKESDNVAVFAPKATINIIKNYAVSSKQTVELPQAIHRVLVCPNPCCITLSESIDSLFHVESFKSTVHLRCHFCERVFKRDEIAEYRV
ncbi:MAG TPA: aspartate carbamoyltransferase regulatory subunit [Rhabdochlamydiaceae bacterium]|jgi:aspartate carbamoyltransferase regulatory subunit